MREKRKWIGPDAPSLRPSADDVFEVDVPGYEMRRLIQARDPLCVANAFFVQVRGILATMLGLRMCPFCPHCGNGSQLTPCTDVFGSNATAEGGVFGRVDAVYASIEAQKSEGSLHAHSQMWIQCLHQHTPLVDILSRVRQDGGVLLQKYLVYKAHVCREVYASQSQATATLESREKEWPEYKKRDHLHTVPAFLLSTGLPSGEPPEAGMREAIEFKQKYVDEHVQRIQECRQHHVHLPDPKTCLLYTSQSTRDRTRSRMPSSA